MKTALFDYHLPNELIAQVPATQRDDSRLLVVDRACRKISHHRFSDLPGFLRAGDCLIRNTARVLPARLFARRQPGGGRVECLLLRPADANALSWWCLLRPGRKLSPGSSFGLEGEFTARVLEKSPTAEYLVAFDPDQPGEGVAALADRLGKMPLPPYVERKEMDATAREQAEADDRRRYQTVFADRNHTVAVAAPTAGLHFTETMLARLQHNGVSFADVVLHVGLGTFRPIETEEVEDHRIHHERIMIPAATRRLLDAPCAGRRLAVGTTSVRTIESYARSPSRSAAPGTPFLDDVDLFIRPPWEFQLVDALITNFHLPRSTLLCLVAAFLTPGSAEGIAWLHEIYAEAVRQRYRFLSYGDAMLIL